ncbi:hypothetical protein M569_13383, partial [Genlisea aurea]
NGGKFCGGFDINVFGRIHETGDISLLPDTSTETTCYMEDARKPSVAAIEGLALGGGLELAMLCHARIATPDAKLGLPELTLGVIPGSGGTQRLPRLIGLPSALDVMLSSKPLASVEAKRLGLVDAVVSSAELLKVSRQWAADIAGGSKPWIRSLHRVDKLGSLVEMHGLIQKARENYIRAAKNTPQYLACLGVIEEGIAHGGYHGILKESKVFTELVLTDASRGLVHAFFSQRAASKVPNVSDIGLKPREVRKVAVIGGGLMGSGIATALIVNGVNVILKEISSEHVKKAIHAVKGNVTNLASRKVLTQDKAEKALLRLKGALDYSEFHDVEMVIEAVIENIPLKQKIFSELEKVCPPHCVLASNTSTIDLYTIGENTASQDRIIGAHFFSPAHLMPLLEVVRTEKTSPQVILDLMTLGKKIKKVPVVVGNCTGFAVNRIFYLYGRGANLLVHLGVDLFRIDQVITDFGFPMGPFLLMDLSGYGVTVAVRETMSSSFSDRTFESPLVDLLLKSGRNGKQNGKGCYIYQKGMKPKPDLSVLAIVEECRKLINIMPDGKPISITDSELVEM